jgi:hypothetical protein
MLLFVKHKNIISDCPVPKAVIKKCNEMKDLYSKIEEAEKNVEKWFKLITKADHYQFVLDNVQFRLGQNLHDKKLWKLYIDYLQQKNPKKMLQIYSRYCRFFLDDDEMFKKYKEKMAENGPVKLFWENLFDFEKIDGSGDDEDKEEYDDDGMDCYIRKSSGVKKKVTEVEPFDKNICAHFYETYHLQKFSLPAKSYIPYILKNANHLVLRKLFGSCKYFFDKKPTPICYRLKDSKCREVHRFFKVSQKINFYYQKMQNILINNN